MIDLAFKNIKRQKSRTALTVLGIVIGIAVIVTLGSFAEGINTFFQSTLELSAGKVMVQQKGAGSFQSGFSGSDITEEQLETIMNIDGVKEVVPVNFYIEAGMGFGTVEKVVVGIDPEKSQYLVGENIGMYEGRELEDDDTNSIILGKNLAESRGLAVGDFMAIKDTEFEVIGIIELANNANVDDSAVTHIRDLQDAMGIDTYQMLYVVPEDVGEVEMIAEGIMDEDENLGAITSKDFARIASQVVDQIRLFMFGMGAIAAVVGGLGVLNTMIMAVLERRKEIGVMKAIGATRRKVLMQILTESMLMSMLGGLVGILLGGLGALGLIMATEGAIPVAVTPGLAASGLMFALVLGAVGGIYPAWQASKVDPVEALRYE